MLTCPDPSWPILTGLDPSRPVLTRPDPSWPVLTSPDPSRPVLNCPDLSWPVPACPDLSRPVLSRPDLSWAVPTCPVQTCPELSWPVSTRPVLTRPVLTCPELSWPVLTCLDPTCPDLLKWSPYCHKSPKRGIMSQMLSVSEWVTESVKFRFIELPTQLKSNHLKTFIFLQTSCRYWLIQSKIRAKKKKYWYGWIAYWRYVDFT